GAHGPWIPAFAGTTVGSVHRAAGVGVVGGGHVFQVEAIEDRRAAVLRGTQLAQARGELGHRAAPAVGVRRAGATENERGDRVHRLRLRDFGPWLEAPLP